MRTLLLLSLALLLASCSDTPPTPQPLLSGDTIQARPIAGEAPRDHAPAAREVIFPLPSLPDLEDLRPLGARSVYMAALLNQVFEGLVGLDDSLRVVPALAASWQISEDLQSYTFQLREDAVFHDGEPLRAEHVQASFERYARYAGDGFWIVAPIVGAEELRDGRAEHLEGFELLADGRVRLRLRAPDGIFLRHLAMPNLGISKPHLHEPFREVGCGPFRFDALDVGAGRVMLQPHVAYHGERPTLALTYQLETQAVRGYQQHTLHIAPFSGPSPLFDSTHVRTWPSMSTTYLAFDLRYQETRSYELRRLVNAVYQRSGFVAGSGRSASNAFGPVPPGLPGHRSELARALFEAPRPLADAVTLYVNFSDLELERALVRALEPYGVLLMRGDQPQIRQSSWIADFPDSDNFLRVLLHSESSLNAAHYSHAGVDSLLVRARHLSAENQAAARAQLYEQVVAQVVADLPWVFLWHTENRLLVHPRLRGLRTCALDFQGALMLPQTRLEWAP